MQKVEDVDDIPANVVPIRQSSIIELVDSDDDCSPLEDADEDEEKNDDNAEEDAEDEEAEESAEAELD